jgi:8-oxo-dGTP diphosphatase
VSIKLPVVNERGERLLAVHFEPTPKGALLPVPTFALVLVTSNDGVLLVLNRHRQLWELPGGMIEHAERPVEAASRELFEESGQVAGQLQLQCVIELEVPSRPQGNNPGVELGVVFGGVLPQVLPFQENHEIDAMAFWKPGEFNGKMSAIDEALLFELCSVDPRNTLSAALS